jgi:uncharacterized protein YodC (DUF2158 family)
MAVQGKYKIGDFVMLKSGGPKMTITSAPFSDAKHYSVAWFAGATDKKGQYPEDAMEPWKDKAKS